MKVVNRFLRLPFAAVADVRISEGWCYSAQEQAIHGLTLHKAIDFSAPLGTPIYAAAAGLAIASEQYALLTDDRGIVRYQSGDVYAGYGQFVMILHPNSWWSVYAHLDKIAKGLPRFHPSRVDDTDWNSAFAGRSNTYLRNRAIWVEQGDFLGRVGVTGLSWGYSEGPGDHPDLDIFPSWDEPHLHFELFRRGHQGKKITSLDPYGKETTADSYSLLDPGVAWELADGKPVFAA